MSSNFLQASVFPETRPLARRNAVDFHALGLPKDHYHASMSKQIVGEAPKQAWALLFVSDMCKPYEDPLGVGFIQFDAYNGEGIENKDIYVRSVMPPQLWNMFPGGRAILRISWPGYRHLNYEGTLDLNQTTGHVASQISKIFKAFYDEHYPNFKGPGIRLGEGFVSYDRLRLRKLWFDGQVWNVELSYIHEPKEQPHWDLF